MENKLPRVTAVTKVSSFVITALCVSVATHAEPGQGYILTAYSDAAGGEQLLSGQYSVALVRLRSVKDDTVSSEAFKKTNVCVAYAIMRKLKEARVACDAAVTAATADRSHSQGLVSKSRMQEDSAIAIAYSNRAIVRSLFNEAVGSAEDLAEAHTLAPQSEYVVRNIAAFKQKPGSSTQIAIGGQRMDD
jgi:hypothetical protein